MALVPDRAVPDWRSDAATVARQEKIAQLRSHVEVAPSLVDGSQLAADLTVPVAPEVASLTLHGGLPRGGRVSLAGGAGRVSLALALMAEPLRQGSWVAVVGAPWLGMAALAEWGVPREQVLVIDHPDRSIPLAINRMSPPGSAQNMGPDQWGPVMASLIDGCDLVLFAGRRVGVREARRLSARAREKGTVLMQLGTDAVAHCQTTWPETADLTLSVTSSRWEGIGDGYGFVRRRRVSVDVTGRRKGRRTVQLWLPDHDGKVRPAEPMVESEALPSSVFAGSDIDLLIDADIGPAKEFEGVLDAAEERTG